MLREEEVKRYAFRVKWVAESFAEEDFEDRGSYMGAVLCRTECLGHDQLSEHSLSGIQSTCWELLLGYLCLVPTSADPDGGEEKECKATVLRGQV